MLPPPPASGLMVPEGLGAPGREVPERFSSQPRGGQSQEDWMLGWSQGGGSHAVGQEPWCRRTAFSFRFPCQPPPLSSPPQLSQCRLSGRALWGEQGQVGQIEVATRAQHTDVSR